MRSVHVVNTRTMLAHVEKKNHQPRQNEPRMTPVEAEELKVPLPAIGHTMEHKRPHRDSALQKQHRHKASRDSKLAKGIGRDVDIIVDDHITDDLSATGVPLSGTNRVSDWRTELQHMDENDLAEFQDIDDMFAHQAMGDQQIEAMKHRLTSGNGYKSTDKYLDGDSYPDTTSGNITDIDALIPREHLSTQAVQDTVRMTIPRTRSAGDYAQPRIQVVQTSNAPDKPSPQTFFKRSDEDSYGDQSAFQMSMVRRGQSTKQPKVAQPQPDVKPQSRPITRSAAYQQARPPHAVSAEAQVAPYLVRGTRSKDQRPPIRAETHMVTVDSSGDHMEEHAHPTYSDDAPTALSPSHDGSHMPRSIELDYDLEALHKMEYKQLREEPFDHDPHTEPDSTHSAQPEESLSAKLNSLAAVPPDEWSHFFYSLNLEMWEDAGDWFIERYSSILTSLKDLRRQRREVAQAFELEVEQRQQAIVRKRISIRNTMDGMRTHGAQVLITPAKTVM